MQQRWRLVVQVEWLSRGGLGSGGPFSVDVVVWRIRFLVWARRPLVVGRVVGWSARWVVLPSHALVLLVHGGLWPGGVGWWAVVVVVVLVVVVVVEALLAPVLVPVMVLRVCPQDPLAFWSGLGVGHCLQPPAPYCLADSGAGWEPGLTATEVEGSHVAGSVWPAGVVVCGGWMTGRLEMGMLTRIWTRSCRVAASVVAAIARGRGARDAVGAGSWLGFRLAFGSGRGRFCCCNTFCGFGGCVGWCC